MAEVKKVNVERTVIEEGLAVHLTMQEARAVWSVLWRVGGNPTESPRGIIDGVRNAIGTAVTGGVNEFDNEWARPELTCAEGGYGLMLDNYTKKP